MQSIRSKLKLAGKYIMHNKTEKYMHKIKVYFNIQSKNQGIFINMQDIRLKLKLANIQCIIKLKNLFMKIKVFFFYLKYLHFNFQKGRIYLFFNNQKPFFFFGKFLCTQTKCLKI